MRIILCSAMFLAALAVPSAYPACQTNQATLLDLSTWSVIQYGPFTQGPAAWILTNNNTVAIQTTNADGSILLAPFTLQNDRIRGAWRVDTPFDDDFMGFVFGYQDTNHFYVFDWKQADQVTGQGAIAEKGMSLKVVHADSKLTETDFYATFPLTTNRVRSLYYNTNIWENFVDYEFSLEFFPGQFTITVVRATNAALVARFTINDSTYTNGQFGFYNFSQGMVRYAGFTRQLLALPPVIRVHDAAVFEGDSGLTDLAFPITLSRTNCDTTTVRYLIGGGTATAGEDYVSISAGTLVFQPGETSKLASLTIAGDLLVESNETVFITLSDPVRGIIGTPGAVGTIIDDDESRPCDPSIIATPLTNLVRCACDEAVFSTTVSSPEPVRFLWKVNGVVIPGETNDVLWLRSLKPEQAGTYTVEIRSRCATNSQSATLALKGGGTQRASALTNSSRITITDNAVATPYPSTLEVECVPGVIRHIRVTLHGLSHNYPDDVDILLTSPAGASVKLMSDAGGAAANKLVDATVAFSDTALALLPDSARILPDVYAPTDHAPADAFPPPAPSQITATNFLPFLGTDPNGTWSLFIRDDTGGDAGSLLGWSISIEPESARPRLSSPRLLPNGQLQITLQGLQSVTHVIEASSNLVSWTPLTFLPSGSETIVYPADRQFRFYRAVCCP